MTVAIVVFMFAIVMLICERIRPGRRWPAVRGWWARAALINGFQIGAVYVGGLTWDRWLRGHSLFVLARHGLAWQIAVGYLAQVLWLYWSHRLRHEIPVLWRNLHQLHHSPQRIEVLTAFYKHPVEIVAEAVFGTAVLYSLLGLSPRAGLVIAMIGGTANLFYHWNFATPHWLGFLIQRPESHCIHHQENVHAYNYCELPLVDMIFGTFQNPKTFDGRCGFGGMRETRLLDLLRGRDVNAADAEDPRSSASDQTKGAEGFAHAAVAEVIPVPPAQHHDPVAGEDDDVACHLDHV
jgi:sterol desaturase/sphingolipid hydroxylase (fatty acid hydroxylase superfamily)